jgi:hypothetical protein
VHVDLDSLLSSAGKNVERCSETADHRGIGLRNVVAALLYPGTELTARGDNLAASNAGAARRRPQTGIAFDFLRAEHLLKEYRHQAPIASDGGKVTLDVVNRLRRDRKILRHVHRNANTPSGAVVLTPAGLVGLMMAGVRGEGAA